MGVAGGLSVLFWPGAGLHKQYGIEASPGLGVAASHNQASAAVSMRSPSPCTGAMPGQRQLLPASFGTVPLAKSLSTKLWLNGRPSL